MYCLPAARTRVRPHFLPFCEAGTHAKWRRTCARWCPGWRPRRQGEQGALYYPSKALCAFGTFARRCFVRCVVSLQYQSSFCAKGMSYRTPTVLRCIRTTRARIPDEFRVCRLYPLEKLEKLDCGEMRASVQVLPYLTYSQLSTLPVQISVNK